MLLNKLLILKSFILIEDKEGINFTVGRLKDDYCDVATNVKELISQNNYAAVIEIINNYVSKHNHINVWVDEEVKSLKYELKELEFKYENYDNELIELQKYISDFEHKHSIELGELILQILNYRKLKFKNDNPKYQEAERDYEHYKEQFKKEVEKIQFELTEEEKKELKSKFRKASILCHPDKVSDELKDIAQTIFIELKSAYECNDLKKVTEILQNLEQGHLFKSKSQTISEKEKLKSLIIELRRKITEIEREINSIKESETFINISSIKNWDDYFKKTKEILQGELSRLKNEFSVSK
jgi:hypothetical protein